MVLSSLLENRVFWIVILVVASLLFLAIVVPPFIRKVKLRGVSTSPENHPKGIMIFSSSLKLIHFDALNYQRRGPNKAGGCNPYLRFLNVSGKDIKCIQFLFTAFNANHDEITNSKSDSKSMLVSSVGPYFANQEYDVVGEELFYNQNLDHFEVDSVNIEYDDGSKQSLAKHEITYINK